MYGKDKKKKGKEEQKEKRNPQRVTIVYIQIFIIILK